MPNLQRRQRSSLSLSSLQFLLLLKTYLSFDFRGYKLLLSCLNSNMFLILYIYPTLILNIGG